MDNNPGPVKTGEVSKILGVRPQRLRKYYNSSIVPGLRPMRLGKHRTFTPEQIDYLRQAVWLSRAGFTRKDLREYVKLAQKADKVSRARRGEMLRTHKRQVWQQLEDLQATIDYLERQEELLLQ